jgi:hypothetical protein
VWEVAREGGKDENRVVGEWIDEGFVEVYLLFSSFGSSPVVRVVVLSFIAGAL